MVRDMAADLLPKLITVDELAAVLRCQPEKVYRLAAAHELPSYKIQGRRLFDEGEVVRWLETQRDCSTLGENRAGR
jgi:excisionase family DNA binding protein